MKTRIHSKILKKYRITLYYPQVKRYGIWWTLRDHISGGVIKTYTRKQAEKELIEYQGKHVGRIKTMKNNHEIDRLITKTLKDIAEYAGVELQVNNATLHTYLERLIKESHNDK